MSESKILTNKNLTFESLLLTEQLGSNVEKLDSPLNSPLDNNNKSVYICVDSIAVGGDAEEQTQVPENYLSADEESCCEDYSNLKEEMMTQLPEDLQGVVPLIDTSRHNSCVVANWMMRGESMDSTSDDGTKSLDGFASELVGSVLNSVLVDCQNGCGADENSEEHIDYRDDQDLSPILEPASPFDEKEAGFQMSYLPPNVSQIDLDEQKDKFEKDNLKEGPSKYVDIPYLSVSIEGDSNSGVGMIIPAFSDDDDDDTEHGGATRDMIPLSPIIEEKMSDETTLDAALESNLWSNVNVVSEQQSQQQQQPVGTPSQQHQDSNTNSTSSSSGLLQGIIDYSTQASRTTSMSSSIMQNSIHSTDSVTIGAPVCAVTFSSIQFGSNDEEPEQTETTQENNNDDDEDEEKTQPLSGCSSSAGGNSTTVVMLTAVATNISSNTNSSTEDDEATIIVTSSNHNHNQQLQQQEQSSSIDVTDSSRISPNSSALSYQLQQPIYDNFTVNNNHTNISNDNNSEFY